MLYRLRHPVGLFAGMLIIGALLVPAVSSADTGKAGTGGPVAQESAVVHDCAWATRVAALGERRYKKVAKKWRNGHATTRHLKWARRIWKAELRQKAQICSGSGGGGGGGGGGNTQPLALTSSEVLGQIAEIARAECDIDANCSSSNAYPEQYCSSKATYQWVCYGWNYEGFGDGSTCDFREVVARSGYNGLTSTRDTSYGNVQGGRFYCHF